MKKAYVKPTMAIEQVRLQAMIAASPNLSTNGAGDYDGGSVDSRGGSIWGDDDEW